MRNLCDKVIELTGRYAIPILRRGMDEPRRLLGRVREDPWYFASVGAGFLVPTVAASLVAYGLRRNYYSNDDIAKWAIITKNLGFFLVNVPLHLYSHRKKFENAEDCLKEAGTIISSNLFGLVVNSYLQPLAHRGALKYGIKDPFAVLLTYPVVGGIVTYFKVLYDDFMGAVGLKRKVK